MHLFSTSAAHRSKLAVAGFILFSCFLVTPSSAESTTIEARLCGEAGAAVITVTEPLDYSNVTHSDVVIKGSVSEASQVDVQIDGQYNSSIALGDASSTFEAPVSLTIGAHTIALTAHDVCQRQDAIQTINITYRPNDVSSTSGAIETNTGGSASIGDPVTEATIPTPTKPLPGLASTLSEALDIGGTMNDGAPRGVMRISLSVAGFTMAVSGVGVVRLRDAGRVWRLTQAQKYRAYSRAARLLSPLLFIGAFFV